MAILLLNDSILIQPPEQAEVSASGLVLGNEEEREGALSGTVVQIGPGRIDCGQRLPMTVQVGDTVIFKQFAPEEISLEGKQYQLISEVDVLAIIRS